MRIELAQCILRSWRRDDALQLAEAGNNRNIWIRVRDRMPHPYTLADTQAYLERVLADESAVVACIEVKGKVGGSIGLHPGQDVYRRTAELGYWIAESYWGRGIATAAVCALVEYGFAKIPLDRIYASAYENNPASVRVLEKAGFEFEGRMRKNVIKDGVVLDSLLYAIVQG
ncbi:MAG: GNAT family N-acetyltransferase [Verrucomicrobiota bacterium]|nr:GNAT family N-acetyltransferase [Verrucomicrobiota bacterium]